MADVMLGSKVGHFRIVDILGTGGMGELFVGYDETLQRKVALKGIRPEYGFDEEAKGRFLREARILSQLGHPNICQVHDYLEGEKSDFIVMELVEGRSLTKALKKGLDARARMRIAEQVAGVLVAAHEKGVVHRDLKPDNVMLTEDDQVKVLDFGLSRRLCEDVTLAFKEGAPPRPDEAATGSPARGPVRSPALPPAVGSEASLTSAGTIMGTLGYMSPEQARGEMATPASDMFSFGLLLQELFTGKSPIEPGLDGMARLERAKRGETLPVTGLDPDLEALINRLKSLAPGARPSAGDAIARLAWIRDKPLRRRKRLLLSAAAAALVLFSLAMAVQSVRATRAEKRAREAEKRARQEAETAEQISGFLVDLFKVSDPSETRGRTITAREILDKGAKRIETGLKDQPLVQARLMNTVGNVYRSLGLYSEAEPLLTSSLAIREKELGPEHPEVADTLNDVASLFFYQGKYAEAEPLFKRSLAIREKALGSDSSDVAKSLNNLAALYLNQGKYAEAGPLFRRCLAIRERALGPGHPDVATSLINLATLCLKQGKYAEAERLYARSLAIKEKALGQDHPEVATNLSYLAYCYWVQGKYAQAEPLSRRALALQEAVLGPDHPNVAAGLSSLASLLEEQGKYDEAEPLYARCLAIQERALGPDHPDVAASLSSLASLHCDAGRFAQSEQLFRRALALGEKALGPDHPDVAASLNNLAILYCNEGRYAEAEPLCKRCLAIQEKALGPEHPYLASGLVGLANLYQGLGQYAEAEPLYRRALAIQEKAMGPGSRETAEVLRVLASCELKEKKIGGALAHSARCVAIARELVAGMPEDPRARFLTASALLLRGQAEAAAGKGAEGLSSWKEAYSILTPVAKDAQSVVDQDTYAQVLLCLGRAEEARPIVKRLADIGYRNPDLAALCRHKGPAPKATSGRGKP